jgi:hypothetical protein
MFYGASVGLLVLGIVFMTQGETRLVGIFWLLAAAVLAFAEWRRRNRAGKAATSRGSQTSGAAGPGQ